MLQSEQLLSESIRKLKMVKAKPGRNSHPLHCRCATSYTNRTSPVPKAKLAIMLTKKGEARVDRESQYQRYHGLRAMRPGTGI